MSNCDPTHCSPPVTSVHGILRQEYWSGLPFPSPGYLPDPGFESRSPALGAQNLSHWTIRDIPICLFLVCFISKETGAQKGHDIVPSLTVHNWQKMLVAQSCLTLCNPMDCSSPGSFVHGISQARILEWVAFPFSRRSTPPRD